jgi:hypothetical protein
MARFTAIQLRELSDKRELPGERELRELRHAEREIYPKY